LAIEPQQEAELGRRCQITLDDIADLLRFVLSVNEFGYRIVLDEFNAGYTSFRHLRGLDVGMVKIDGSFVRDLPINLDN
jgi:EAL domain-containing protein (putative c-di-GMP-specific phosphodiesterase class I)